MPETDACLKLSRYQICVQSDCAMPLLPAQFTAILVWFILRAAAGLQVLEVKPELANYTFFNNHYNVMHHAAGIRLPQPAADPASWQHPPSYFAVRPPNIDLPFRSS
jgi:hypothetical protein